MHILQPSCVCSCRFKSLDFVAHTDVAPTCCSAHYTEPEALYASQPAEKGQKQKKAAARGGQKGGGAISKRKASSEVEALHGKIGDALSLLGTMLD